ncbi:MAG: DUF3857 domain-containing protein [Panacibacter sp.]
MKMLPVTLFLFFSFTLSAQNYNILFIPDSLTKKADAVKRFEEIHIIVKSVDKAVIKHKYAITILNEDGDGYAQYYNYYSKLKELSDISGNLYDAWGKKIKSIKKKDIEDVSSGTDVMNIMNDSRIKVYNFHCKQYPYTVEFEDEETYNGILYFPSWQPFENQYFAVQQSRLLIETPVDYKLRFKQFNYPSQPFITKGTSNTSYLWEIKNAKAFIGEILSPPTTEILPQVFIAPTNFSIGGYTGNMATWLDLGKFQTQLNKGRDELPDNIKQEVHKLTDQLSDPVEKIKALYAFLQNNTRYINVTLGMGGWQPFDAKYVATNRYGDCKALSNYMHALLKEAGINGYYTLIKAGENNKNFMPDFPSRQSNHIIITIPMAKDTMWLECTDQQIAPGFLGNFTDDRYALMIKDDGGYVIKTPTYTSKENLQLRKTTAIIDDAGNLTADANTHFTGLQQEDVHYYIHNANKESRAKYLNTMFNLPTYNVDKYDYKEQPGIIPVVDEYLHITSPGYATVSGKRLFVQPNLFNKSATKLSKDSVRKYDIEYTNAYKDADTISITIPAGYTPEAMPSNTSISNKFGTYSISFKVTGNQIEVLRVQVSDKARYPASDYPDLVKFYDDIYKADRSRIVFVKKEG